MVALFEELRARIRGNYHESSICFEYPKNPYLNQATQKITCQNFLPKNLWSRNQKFQTPKDPSIIPVTWNAEYLRPSLTWRGCKIGSHWTVYRGTQQEILKQQKSMNKAFWSHFKHFERLLGKICLFLAVRLMEEFPACKVHLQPGLQTYVQTLLASLGVVIGQYSPLRSCRGGGGRRGLWFITHSNYSGYQIPSDTMNYSFS